MGVCGMFCNVNTTSQPENDATRSCAPVAGSGFRFTKRLDTEETVTADFRGHSIQWTKHWRSPDVWQMFVHDKTGILVADWRVVRRVWAHADRTLLLVDGARHAGLIPNTTMSNGSAAKNT